MDRKLIDPRIVSDIADAVREKGGTTEPIVVNQLPQAIRDLPMGGNENVSEVVEMVSGVASDNDLVLANTIAKSVTETPSEVTFSKRASGAIRDGVAYVKSFKGNTITEEGKVYGMTANEMVVRGVNLWDEEWELGYYDGGVPKSNASRIRGKNYIKVIGGSSVFVRSDNVVFVYPLYYDADFNFISDDDSKYNAVVTIPSNAAYMRFWCFKSGGITTYNHDICINISKEGVNGNYYPYVAPSSFPLPWADLKDVEGNALFPNGLNGIGDLKDEVNETQAVKRYGIKVFDGTENWKAYQNYYYCDAFTAAPYSKGSGIRAISNYYTATAASTMVAVSQDKAFHVFTDSDTLITFYDSAYTLDAWKAHLADLYAQGKPLVVFYELAEPIVVDLEPWKEYYHAEVNGTEEIDPSSAPLTLNVGYQK